MRTPSKEQLVQLRERYKKGTIVRLNSMDDSQAPPSGTIGEVFGVDDMGSVMVHWSNGSSLSLIPGEDSFEIVEQGPLTEKIKSQILAVRDTGETNMFDTNMVQLIANRMGFHELVIFVEDHKSDYVSFIINGDINT